MGKRGVFEILIAKAPTFIEFSVGTTLLAPKRYHKSLEFKYNSLYMHFRASLFDDPHDIALNLSLADVQLLMRLP